MPYHSFSCDVTTNSFQIILKILFLMKSCTILVRFFSKFIFSWKRGFKNWKVSPLKGIFTIEIVVCLHQVAQIAKLVHLLLWICTGPRLLRRSRLELRVSPALGPPRRDRGLPHQQTAVCPRFGPAGLATNSIFFCLLFVKKIIDWQINDPSLGKTLFSFVPPSNFLVSVWDPWRAFWADKAPIKGLDLPCALLPELQR